MKNKSAPNYNICLIPVADDSAFFIRAAQAYASIADGYCLSNKALPHVTICQIYADDISQLPLRLVSLNPPSSLMLTHARLRPGIERYAGADWLEIAVEKTPDLITFKTHVDNVVSDLGLAAFTGGGDIYAPHLTYCRVGGACTPPAFESKEFPFTLALGKSDTNGQLLSIEWTKP